jgi:hypothetical protein
VAHDVDRHGRPVVGRRPRAFGHVSGEVHVRRRCRLEELPCATDDVLAVERRGSGEGLCAVPEIAGVPLRIGPELDLVWLGACVEDALASIAEQHAQPLLGISPLVQHEVALERFGVDDPARRLVGDELVPGAGRLDRSRHHAEVGCLEVGDDHESVAPVLDVVLHFLRPWTHDGCWVERRTGVEEAHLAVALALRRDRDPFAAAGRLDADVEPLVLLPEDAHVGVDRSADLVPPHLVGSALLVGAQVEQPRSIHRPGDPAGRGAGDVVEVGATVEVADAEPVLLVAVRVRRPGDAGVVVRWFVRVEGEEVVSVRLPVAVEDGGLGR